MNNIVVSVENVSKKYCKSLKRSMLYGMADIVRNSIGKSSNSFKLRKKEFWALKDVSFELKKGETLGIIGPNGAGKSTMLKMLNGIFWPDKGRIVVRGKVGALIEVGAGFHPMLSGRENIYINGAILGMNRSEINRKFDQIVEFSEVGDFIDTPVKYYSSGMFVRLGFSIAVHSNPDILLVDEILSVGDLNFQAKSKKKIVDLLDRGISIVLVSHNLNLISTICKQTLYLSKTYDYFKGDTIDIIDKYRESILEKSKNTESFGTGEIVIKDVTVLDRNNVKSKEFKTDETVIVEIKYKAMSEIRNPVFAIAIFNLDGTQIAGIRTDMDNIYTGILNGEGVVRIILDRISLLPGVYSISANIFEKNGLSFYSRVINITGFKILGGKKVYGYISLPHKWIIE